MLWGVEAAIYLCDAASHLCNMVLRLAGEKDQCREKDRERFHIHAVVSHSWVGRVETDVTQLKNRVFSPVHQVLHKKCGLIRYLYGDFKWIY
jgi:hypothetical protein